MVTVTFSDKIALAQPIKGDHFSSAGRRNQMIQITAVILISERPEISIRPPLQRITVPDFFAAAGIDLIVCEIEIASDEPGFGGEKI